MAYIRLLKRQQLENPYWPRIHLLWLPLSSKHTFNLHFPLRISPSVSLTWWSFFSGTEESYPACTKKMLISTEVSAALNLPISTSQRHAVPFTWTAAGVLELIPNIQQCSPRSSTTEGQTPRRDFNGQSYLKVTLHAIKILPSILKSEWSKIKPLSPQITAKRTQS